MENTAQSSLILLLDQLASGADIDVSEVDWPQSLDAASPEYRAAKQTIAKLRHRGKIKTALALARSLSARLPDDRSITLQLGRILWADKKYDEAAKLLDGIGSINNDHEWYSVRAAVFAATGGIDEGLNLTKKFREAAPMVMMQRNRQDLPVVAILGHGPALLNVPLVAAQAHFRANFISQYATEVTDRFRFASYWVNAKNVDAALRTSPSPDLVVNNLVTGELAGDPEMRPNLRKCIKYWNKGCINSPKDVLVTARDKLATALSRKKQFVAPKTLFLNSSKDKNSLGDQIEAEFDYPLILRAPFLQNGGQMYLVEDRDQALEIIPTLKPGFFAIEFIENLHEGGMYRKMRGAFIEDDFFMLRVDYGPDWMIHGHRDQAHRIDFYNENQQYLDEEIAICKDPARMFGKPVMKALRELRSIIKLDYFGVDFDISSDGKLIVYEANAAMNFLSKRGLVHPHPKESGDALTRRFTKLLVSRIDRPKMAMIR